MRRSVGAWWRGPRDILGARRLAITSAALAAGWGKGAEELVASLRSLVDVYDKVLSYFEMTVRK